MAHSQYLSNVYLYGQNEDKDFSRDEVTVTISTGTGADVEMRSGAVMGLVGGKYIWSLIATVGNSVGVLADPRADDEVVLANGDHTLLVLLRDAGIGENYLTWGDGVSAANKTTSKVNLLTKGLKSEAQA